MGSPLLYIQLVCKASGLIQQLNTANTDLLAHSKKIRETPKRSRILYFIQL